jgi:hypothetical protein
MPPHPGGVVMVFDPSGIKNHDKGGTAGKFYITGIWFISDTI